jgi:hypothetical protein
MLLRKNELPVAKPALRHLFYAVHVPRVLVIGASLAGLRAVETSRSHDFDGEITVCDTEYTVLYDRPPLSKKFLEGEWEADRIRVRKAEDIDALNAKWLTGHRATHLDAQSRIVAFDNGTTQTFDACIIATVHYMMSNVDGGPIIEQDLTRVSYREDVAKLTCRRCEIEIVVLACAPGHMWITKFSLRTTEPWSSN